MELWLYRRAPGIRTILTEYMNMTYFVLFVELGYCMTMLLGFSGGVGADNLLASSATANISGHCAILHRPCKPAAVSISQKVRIHHSQRMKSKKR